jgi:cell division protein FtsL
LNRKKEPFLTAKSSIAIIFIMMAALLLLFMPKIFLRNNIYYLSKDINKLHSQYISLKEENKFLAQQLETMKYKNQIMDSLLLQSLDDE